MDTSAGRSPAHLRQSRIKIRDASVLSLLRARTLTRPQPLPFNKASEDVYDSLDPHGSLIRLLWIPSNSAAGQLHCTLKTVSLDDCPIYGAFSYMWGDRSTKEEIIVNGHTMVVTLNLAQALRCVASGHGGLYWVDALCINQNDINERNHQVQLMEKIYSHADHVLAFLGLGEIRDDIVVGSVKSEALSFIRSIWGCNIHIPPNQFCNVSCSPQLSQVSADDRLDEEMPAVIRLLHANPELFEMHYGLKDDFIESWKDSINLGMTGSRLWDLLAGLGSDPYWTRVWIVQELVLAKRIIFVGLTNDRWCDETDLIACLDWLGQIRLEYADKKPEAMAPALWNILTETDFPLLSWATEVMSLRRSFKNGVPFGMVEALTLALNSDATDPRDSIYGVLGLCDIGQEPDYRLKMSEVFVEFFHRWLLQVGSLNILCFAGRGVHAFWQENEPDLVPTFVPDWRKIRESHRVKILGLFAPLGSASGKVREVDGSAAQQTSGAYLENSVLHASGVQWDIVESPVNLPTPKYPEDLL